MIVLKSHEEIELMAKAASVTAAMLEEIPNILMPGMTTLELDHWCEDYILRHQMKPAFKGYGGFPGTACVSVNEEVVHGIPTKRRVLQEGDIVSVDLGPSTRDSTPTRRGPTLWARSPRRRRSLWKSARQASSKV